VSHRAELETMQHNHGVIDVTDMAKYDYVG
jgi:hypothetical protein